MRVRLPSPLPAFRSLQARSGPGGTRRRSGTAPRPPPPRRRPRGTQPATAGATSPASRSLVSGSEKEKLRPPGVRGTPAGPKPPVARRGGPRGSPPPGPPRPTNRRSGCTPPPPRAATPALPPPSPSGPAARAAATGPSAPASAAAPCWQARCHLSLRRRGHQHVSAGPRTYARRGLAVGSSRGAGSGRWAPGGAGPERWSDRKGGAWQWPARGAGPERWSVPEGRGLAVGTYRGAGPDRRSVPRGGACAFPGLAASPSQVKGWVCWFCRVLPSS